MGQETLGACDLGLECLCDYDFGHLQSVRDAIVRDHAKGEEQAERDNRVLTVERMRGWLFNRGFSPNSGVNKNWKRMRAKTGKERAA